MSDTGPLVPPLWPMLPPDRQRAAVMALGRMLLRQLRSSAPSIGETGNEGRSIPADSDRLSL